MHNELLAVLPELVPSVDVLLLEAEDDWSQVLVVGEVVPVLGAVEVALVSLLFHRCQFERTAALELLLDGRFAPHPVADLRQKRATHLRETVPDHCLSINR